jgi:hypothetical protein
MNHSTTSRLFRQQGDTNITARKKLFSGKADEADETAGRIMQLCLAWTHSDKDIDLGKQFNMRVVNSGSSLREAENSARIGDGAPCSSTAPYHTSSSSTPATQQWKRIKYRQFRALESAGE